MNDEIKEILDNLRDYCKIAIDNKIVLCNRKEMIQLLDYITNLQQEHKNSQITLAEEWKKRLEAEEKIKHLDNQVTMLKQQNNSITTIGLDYKTRIDKAIEYIENEYQDNVIIVDHTDYPITPQELYGELLDILKGDDINEEK